MQARGQEFDSPHLHHLYLNCTLKTEYISDNTISEDIVYNDIYIKCPNGQREKTLKNNQLFFNCRKTKLEKSQDN